MFRCPIRVDAPIYLYAPYLPCTSVCPPILHVPQMSWGLWGASVHPICLEVFEGISTSLRHFCVCQYIHCLTIHYSHTSHSSSLGVASLLALMSMDFCSASCCCSFLCSVFIMSQAFTTMATTTTPLVTIVCSSM